MVYKRYIKKKGKLYGPYEYHSIKKDGKVVSEYRGKGTKKKTNVNRKILASVFLLVVLGLSFFLLGNFSLTGKATLSMEKTYALGEEISGSVKIGLREGELLPASTKVIIDNAGSKSEYLLSDLIDVESVEGDFYLDNVNIFGNGFGYGVPGEKKTYPAVNFVLKLSKSVDNKISKEKIEEKEEKVKKKSSAVEEKTKEPKEDKEKEEKEKEDIEETKEDKEKEEKEKEDIEEPKEEKDKEDKEKEKEDIEEPKEDGKDKDKDKTSGDIVKESKEIDEEETSSPITGEVIDSFDNSVLVKGAVSKDEFFIYELGDWNKAEIFSSTQGVDLKIKSGKAIVTTDYYEGEEGFGAEYIEDKKWNMNLDLSSFGLKAKQGVLSISFIYNDEEILFVSEEIGVYLENVTEVEESNIETIQYGAVLGKPVKWKKKILVEEPSNLSVEIPREAMNITVYKIFNETETSYEEIEIKEENKSETQEVEEVISNKTGIEKEIEIKEEQPQANVAITGMVSAEMRLGEKSKIISFFKKTFQKISGGITGRVIDITESEDVLNVFIEDNATEFEIEYETPAPVAFETEKFYGKEVVISSDYPYKNVLAYTELPRSVPWEQVKVYHNVNGSRTKIEFVAYDANGEFVEALNDSDKEIVAEVNEILNSTEDFNETSNKLVIYGEDYNSSASNYSIKEIIEEVPVVQNLTLVSYIEWVVPSLSNQTYEIVIEIVGAEHLDENRTFIEDIYEQVKVKDNIWSPVINDSHYVRVSFEQPLDNTSDITIYAQGVENSTGSIEVYLENGNDSIASIENISEEGWYKTYLYEMVGSSGIFDLKISGNLEFDYIVDPYYLNVSTNASSTNNITTENQEFSHLTIDKTGEEYLSLDGVDDYVNITSSGDLGLSNAITVSAWIKTNQNDRQILEKLVSGTSGFRLQIGSGDQAIFTIAGVGGNQADVGPDVVDGTWHHVLGRFNGTHIEVFSDGSGTGSPTAANYTPNTLHLLIGRLSGQYFNGSLDEVMIFNRSLSQSEINILYELNRSDSNISSSDLVGYWTFDDDTFATDSSGEGNNGTFVDGASVVLDKTYPYSFGNDLILYMPFDVVDGNGTWVAGNNSGGLSFDGVDDYVEIADADSLSFGNGVTDNPFSISNWAHIQQSSNSIFVGKMSSSNTLIEYRLYTVGTSLYFVLYDDSETAYIGKSCGSLSSYVGEWIYLTAIYDGTDINGISVYLNGAARSCSNLSNGEYVAMENLGNPLYIGGKSSDYYFNGSIDEVLIFNRTLNSTDIEELYTHSLNNRTDLVGEWLLDEPEGLVARDTAGTNDGDLQGYGDDTRYTRDYTSFSNDGTISGNAYWDRTAGYIGSAYDFDGVNDYINCGNPSGIFDFGENDFTISWWMKGGSKGGAISKYNAGDTGTGFILPLLNDSLYFRDGTDNLVLTSSQVFLDNSWKNVVAKRNATGFYVYVNGVQTGFDAGVSIDSLSRAQTTLWIGSAQTTGPLPWGYIYNGSLDEVMIFNRSLSQSEIQEIYNNQSARFYPTGEILFESLDFGNNDTINLTLDNCQTEKGSYLQGKINDGVWMNFSGCSFTGYDLSGLENLNDSNFTARLVADGNLFYSPIVIGNISLNEYVGDGTPPTITFESPTPDNNSITDDAITIKANISDNSAGNTSSWIDWDNSLVGYWMMGDSYNATGIFDNSSNDNFGTFNGGIGTDNLTQGARGYGLEFDGDNDDIHLNTINLSTTHSMSYWVKLDAFDATYAYVLSDASSSDYVRHQDSTTISYIADGGTESDLTTTALNLGQWYYVTITRNSTTINLYINGTWQDTNTLVEDNSFILKQIGYQHPSIKVGVDGSIDEVLIFNRSLSQSEISALYNSKSNKFQADFSSLSAGQHNYTMYAIDEAGNLNNSIYRLLNVDTAVPSVVISSPSNNSYASSSVKIDADISDTASENTYAFINDTNLVGYWTFDSTNSTGVFDTSGEDNFGSFAGGIAESDLTDGRFGDSLEFDGVGDYVQTPHDFSGKQEFSVSLWAYTKTQGKYRTFWAANGASSCTGDGLFLAASNILYFRVANSAVTANIGDVTNKWIHIVAVYNSTNRFVYINGTKVLSGAGGSPTDGTVNFQIGNYNGCTPNVQFNGSLDEVLIFNRTLSEDEIKALYNSSAQKFNVSYTLPSSGQNIFDLIAVDEGANINLTQLFVTNDVTYPSITFESVTPDNNSITDDAITIKANITDSGGRNSSSWIDWDNSLVGYWMMGDSYNATGIFDNSSNSNFGTFTGGLGTSNLTQGARGYGLEFDGVGDYVLLNNRIDTSTFSGWSAFSWIKYYDNAESYGAIFGGNALGIRTITNKLYSDDNTAIFSTATITEGVWTHVGVVCNNLTNILTFYIGGVNDSSQSYNCDYSNAYRTKYLGRYGTNVQNFNGSLDEVLIFNRSLSEDEINALYNSKVNKFNASFSSLSAGQHNYTMYAIDEAGNLNNSIYRLLNVDASAPSVVVNSPMNNSYASSDVKIDADISDSASENTYAFINDTDLVGYWTFDSTNSTGVYDTSGEDNFGSFNGGIGETNLTDGYFGDSLEFDGVGDRITTNKAMNKFITASTGTISVWVKPTGTAPAVSQPYDGQTIVASLDYIGIYRASIGGQDRIWAYNWDGSVDKIGISYTNDNWIHVVLVRGNGDLTAYANGNLIDSINSGDTTSLANPLTFGKTNKGSFFNGSIDDILIFNRSLSEDEIKALYNSSSQKFNVSYTLPSSGQNIFDLIAVDEGANINLTQLFVTNDVTLPTISFINPTPDDGLTTGNDFVIINTTITDDTGSDRSAWIDWNKSLVGYWSFDNVNATGVFDNSSNNNFGTFTGVLGTSNLTQGARGYGLEFDGVGDYIDTGYSFSGTEITFSAWINLPQNAVQYETIWGSYDGSNQIVLWFWGSSNHLSWTTYDGTTRGIEDYDAGISVSNWYYLTAVYNGTHYLLYVNGNLETTDEDTFSHPSNTQYIGARHDRTEPADWFLNVKLDEVLIFNRTLSEDEIRALYNNSAYRYNATISGLADGQTYNYSMYAIDEAGNLNITSPDRQVTADFTNPSITFESPTPEDGFVVGDSFFFVNASVSDTNNVSSFIDFNNSLVGWWRMDEHNSTGVQDYLGINNGTFNGGLGSSDIIPGQRGDALDFDGDDDYVDCGNDEGLNITDMITIEAWVKISSFSDYGGVVLKTNPSSWLAGYGIVTVSSQVRFFVNEWDNNYAYATLATDQWYHIVGTFNKDAGANNIKIFVNGVEGTPDTLAAAITTTTQPLYIGWNYLSGYTTNGSIDNVMIFNRSLSLEEIQGLYGNSSSRYLDINYTGLVERDYPFKAYVQDAGGNVNLTSLRTTSVDFTAPTIDFVSPTESNGSSTANNYLYVNVSTSDTNEGSVFLDWDSSLVGYWTMGDSYNSTGIFDNSSNSNFGTFNGGLGTSDIIPGKRGDALEFDGVGDYVDLGTRIQTETFSEWSTFAWIKYYDSGWNTIFGGYVLVIPSTDKLASRQEVGYMYSTNTITEGVWTHVGITCDNSTDIITFYINGINDSSQSYDCDYSNSYRIKYIGSYNGALYFWNGSIDDVMIFNRSLSLQEIQSIYNATAYEHNFTGLSDGSSYTAQAYSVDLAGNMNTTDLWTFTIDQAFPTISWVNPATDNSSEFSSAFNLNITFADTNLFKTLINITNSSGDSVYSNQTDDENITSHTYADLVNLTQDGTYTIEASATDDHTDSETDLKKSKKGETILVFNSTSSDLEMEVSFIKKNGQPQSLPGDFASSISELTEDGNYKFGFNFTVVSKGDKMVLNITSTENLTYRTEVSGYKGHFVWDNYYFDFEDLSSDMNLSVEKINDLNYLLTIEDEDEWAKDEFIDIDPVAGGLNTVTEHKTFYLDTTPPQVTITSPTATTYTSSSISFAVRTNENSTCNYSLNSGVTNYTMTANSTGTGFTVTRTLSNADYVSNFYCADIYGNANNTESVSFTVAVPSAEVVSTPGGGGGGGGSVPAPKDREIETSYETYESSIALNKVEFDVIEISNTGNLTEEVTITVETIGDIITFETYNLTLESGESKSLEFRLSSPKNAGIYTGKIIIKSIYLEKQIPVVVNVKTEQSLFDITFSVPDKMKVMAMNKNFKLQINLLQMGLKEKVDVTLHYLIKDFNGNIHLSESETIAVYDQKSFEKEFYTENLSPGDYVFGTELLYPGGVAVASSQFKIKERIGFNLGSQTLLLSLILILAFVSLMIIIAIKRYKRIEKHLLNRKKR